MSSKFQEERQSVLMTSRNRVIRSTAKRRKSQEGPVLHCRAGAGAGGVSSRGTLLGVYNLLLHFQM